MVLRIAALACTLALIAAPAFAGGPPPNSFTLVSSTGKTLGNASYTIDKTKDGFRVKSHFDYRLAAAPVGDSGSPDSDMGRRGSSAFTYVQDNAELKYDASGSFLSGFLQNQADEMLTSFQPNKKRTAVTVSHMQGGTIGQSSDLPLPAPQFLLAPDYDPCAIQVLLTTALTHPHPDSTYLLLVPGATARANDSSLYVIIQPAPDTPSGTLDGKPITLKHYFMNYHSGHADLYSGPDGALMEAVMNPLDADYIRTGFKLSTP